MQINDQGHVTFPAIRLRTNPSTFIGTFQNEEQLAKWADKHLREDYVVVFVTPPSELTSS